jgi:serine/threonine protein kinase
MGTLEYEPPEAAMHPDMPMSRLYDIWSMGCIIFESLIWLLHGLECLNSFYNAKFQLHRARAPYCSVDSEGTERLIEEVLRWYKETFAQDPECNTPAGTALGDLLDLVKTKLLVIARPDRRLPDSPSTLSVEQNDSMASSAPSWQSHVPTIRID